MEYTELGSTGIEVSVLSLGAGGSSKLGLNKGKSEQKAEQVVETALEHGVNLIDTAEVYETEEVVGNAITGKERDDVVLSSKFLLYDDGDIRTPEALEESVNQSLERLNTEYLDIYHLHGVRVDDYEYALEELVPRMERLKEEGTIRSIGVTESTATDPGHEMLSRAVTDDCWDVLMVGYNLLNHSARDKVLIPAVKNGIGTIGMVAVRRALSDPQALTETIHELIQSGEIDPEEVDPTDPFGFLIHDEGASDIFDAAYRFCRHDSTIDTVLTGTSSPDHLAANVDSICSDPLSEDDLVTLKDRFGTVESVIGN